MFFIYLVNRIYVYIDFAFKLFLYTNRPFAVVPVVLSTPPAPINRVFFSGVRVCCVLE